MPVMDEATTEPDWLHSMRGAAHQRPRTQFQRIRWAYLQKLLTEYDILLAAADEKTLTTIETMRKHSYARS